MEKGLTDTRLRREGARYIRRPPEPYAPYLGLCECFSERVMADSFLKLSDSSMIRRNTGDRAVFPRVATELGARLRGELKPPVRWLPRLNTLSHHARRRSTRRNIFRRLMCVLLCSSTTAVIYFGGCMTSAKWLSSLTVTRQVLSQLGTPTTVSLPLGRYAYATLVTTHTALPGAISLASSWKELNPTWDRLVVILYGAIQAPHLADLKLVFTKLIFAETSAYVNENTTGRMPFLTGWLAKFELLRQMDYTTILYVDADVVMFRDCSELVLHKYAFQMTFGIFYAPFATDGGMYVLTPNISAWHELKHIAGHIGTDSDLDRFIHRPVGYGDQGLVDYALRHGRLRFERLEPKYVQLKRIPYMFPNLFVPICGIHFPTSKPWDNWAERDVLPFLPLVLFWRGELARYCASYPNLRLCGPLKARFKREERHMLRASFLSWLRGTPPFNIQMRHFLPSELHKLRHVEFRDDYMREVLPLHLDSFANECVLTVEPECVRIRYCIDTVALIKKDSCTRNETIKSVLFKRDSFYTCTRLHTSEGLLDIFTESFIEKLSDTHMESVTQMRPCIYLIAKMCTTASLQMESGQREAQQDLLNFGMKPESVKIIDKVGKSCESQ